MYEPVIRQKAHALAVEFVGTSRRDVTYEEAIDMLLAMAEFCVKRQTRAPRRRKRYYRTTKTTKTN